MSCFIGLIAPTLLITAFAFLDPNISIAKITDVEHYNQAVVSWREKIRLEFSSYGYIVNITYIDPSRSQGYNNSTTFSFIQSKSSEHMKTTENILKYTPLSFNCNITSIIPPLYLNTDNNNNNLTKTASSPTNRPSSKTTSSSSNNNNPYLNINLYSNNIKSQQILPMLSIDVDLYQYNDYYSKKFNGFCIVVKNLTQIDDQPCLYGSFDILNYTYINNFDQSNVVIFTNVILRIKHVEDPYVVAAQITSGTFSFAMSKSTQESLGTFLLILGGVFTVLFVLIILMMVKKKGLSMLYGIQIGVSNKNHHHHHHHDPSIDGLDGIAMSNLDMIRTQTIVDSFNLNNSNSNININNNNLSSSSSSSHHQRERDSNEIDEIS